MLTALYLAIDGKMYHLERIPADAPVQIAWELLSFDGGNKYHVHRDQHGRHCTCPDFVMRGKENAPPHEQCKHVLAMIDRHLV